MIKNWKSIEDVINIGNNIITCGTTCSQGDGLVTHNRLKGQVGYLNIAKYLYIYILHVSNLSYISVLLGTQ